MTGQDSVRRHSRTERLMREIRKTAVFRELVPQEAGVGWPMPFRRRGGDVYVSLLFFGYQPDPSGEASAIFPPLSMVTVDWARWRPEEYLNLRFRHPWADDQCEAQVGEFPHPAVRELTVAGYRRLRSELLADYDELLEHLTAGKPFTDSFTARFGMRLRLLMEPGLEPYYRALSPGFFAKFLPAPAPGPADAADPEPVRAEGGHG